MNADLLRSLFPVGEDGRPKTSVSSDWLTEREASIVEQASGHGLVRSVNGSWAENDWIELTKRGAELLGYQSDGLFNPDAPTLWRRLAALFAR